MKKKLSLLVSVFAVLFCYSQTTGPSQPEAVGFSAIGSNDMVDLYTGNFKYNIPIMTVPGPDGGYPINLIYNSSTLDMESAASWVGLGWLQNNGAIVRSLRGIPDDFMGDTISKTIWMKPNVTVGVGVGVPGTGWDIFSGNLELGFNSQIYYNNYSGIGIKGGLSLQPLKDGSDNVNRMRQPYSLNLNYGTNEGIGLSPALSFNEKMATENGKAKGTYYTSSLGMNFNSKQGTVNTNLSFRSLEKLRVTQGSTNSKGVGKTYDFNGGGAFSFASGSPIQSVSVPRKTTNLNFGVNYQGSFPSSNLTSLSLNGNISISKITKPERILNAFGTLYMDKLDQDENFISDFYKEHNEPTSLDYPIVPMFIQTFDMFTLQGHGVGGAFRFYRNSSGVLTSEIIESKGSNLEIGVEFGSGSSFNLGADLNFAKQKSYSGPWKKNTADALNYLNYYSTSSEFPLYEAVYPKLIGEETPSSISDWNRLENENPIQFDLGTRMGGALHEDTKKRFSFGAHVLQNTINKGNNFNINNTSERDPRVVSIEYKTKQEILDEGLSTNSKYILNNGGTALESINYNQYGKGHHINEISALKANGTRYVYGLPAYNIDEEKVTYSTMQTSLDGKVVPVDVNENKIKNNTKGDKYYSREEVSPYVHSWMITSILSYDYIDIDNNGPSNNDLGTWVKFIYDKAEDYDWRFPYDVNSANYIKGYESNTHDDKASYTSGEKILYYTKAIETKTHIAIYELANTDLIDADRNIAQKQLDEIKLYSKSDPNYVEGFYLNGYNGTMPTPIQSAHFIYDYSLKPNTPNSINPTSNGTLTFKELYFTYQDNPVGQDAKYQFAYKENPDYQAQDQDRWGAYQTTINGHNPVENPHTYQGSLASRDSLAAAWALSEIILPSKGKIMVTYEKDSYKFVQEKQALQYLQIVGISNAPNSLQSLSNPLNKDNSFIYFKAPRPMANKAEMFEYIKNIEYLGYKVFLYLRDVKPKSGSDFSASDYIKGYATIDFDSGTYGVLGGANSDIGYFKVKTESPKGQGFFDFHPMQLAGLQYLRNQRPDLQTQYSITDLTNPVGFVTSNLDDMLSEVGVLMKGYYKHGRSLNWASNLDDDKPSFVRLNVIDEKFGGDNRVRKIELYSYATDSIPRYGKEYSYLLEDGTSSGVAEFEPLLGIEETAHSLPIWYDANDKLLKFANENSFLEEPVAAALYPGPTVGYSRVIERNLSHDLINLTQSGVNVTEFYTAKDFPTESYRSDDPTPFRAKPYNINATIPFIGVVNINNTGSTMGYSTVLNNHMYGAVKRTATYPYTKEDPSTLSPVSSTTNYYKTKNDGSLNNEVTALMKEGQTKQILLGKETEFYVGLMENRNRVIGGGLEPDVSFTPPLLIIPSIMPEIQFYQSISRYVSSTKITYNTGILDSIVQTKDGSKIVTKNLLYDYETGEPIVTSVTQEWERPVYSYNFPAHWSYPAMRGAYNNYKAPLKIQSKGSKFELVNNLAFSNLIESQILFDGDEIMLNGTRLFVSDVTFSDFALNDREDNPASITGVADAFVTRSGFKNLQSTKKGGIVTLRDPSVFTIDHTNQFFTNLSHKFNNSNQNFPVSHNIIPIQLPVTPYPSVNGASSWYETDRVLVDVDTVYECNGTQTTARMTIDQLKIGYREVNIGGLQIKLLHVWGEVIFRKNGSLCGISQGFVTNADIGDFIYTPQLASELANNINNFHFETYDDNYIQLLFEYEDPMSNLDGFKLGVYFKDSLSCNDKCGRKPSTVLQASATEFSEDWSYDYNDLKDETTISPNATLSDIADNSIAGNDYAFGLKGIWRPERTWAYLSDRNKSGSLGDSNRIDIDGEFEEFYGFDHSKDIEYNEDYNWRWTNEVTAYNVNGSSIEGKNRLHIFSASIFGYLNHLVTAVANNAEESEILFDGFEGYDRIPYGYENKGRSNLNLGVVTIGPWAHSGNSCLAVESSGYEVHQVNLNSSKSVFIPKRGKKYSVSYWTQSPDSNIPLGYITYQLAGGSQVLLQNLSTSQVIDGWFHVYGEFTIPASTSLTTSFSLQINSGSSDYNALFDDLRIHPYNSTMESYVYDQTTYRLKAILNNLNFTTFFIYDSEGALVEKKIETDRGIQTLTTNRNNIMK